MKYIDTETVGLLGPIVLIQYATDDGDVEMFSPWRNTVLDTLKVLEEIIFDPEGVCGFNLAFDWFKICQMYTTLLLLKDVNAYLEDCVEEYALAEPQSRFGPCCKPKAALDLMLFARKGPYQSTMKRDPIRIKRVPTAMAWDVAKVLEEKIKLKDIYFGKRKDKKADRWKVIDIKDSEGRINTEFKDIKLKFAPTSALKALAIDALGLDPNETLIYEKISLPKKLYPMDKRRGYAPYALAHGSPGNWNGTWPDYIKFHSDHWAFNDLAREYAKKDVVYLQQLRAYFGNPPLGDDDSELACMVGAIRWRGYKLDLEKIKALREKAIIQQKSAPTTPAKVKYWVSQLLDDTEKTVMKGSTKKAILEEISNMLADCPACKGNGCESCNNKGTIKHPAAERAKACLEARKAGKRIDVCDKLLRAGRFHASFIVLGTKSQRMAGTDDLNAQGIDHTKEMRSCFTLADIGYNFAGGDFISFEPCLAAAVYDDPSLTHDLKSGKSIHSLFGMELYPHMTYEEIEASKGSKDHDYRDDGKRGFLAICYGGNEFTLRTKLNIDEETGKKAIENFVRRKYKQMGIKQDMTRKRFCSMVQPQGIGKQVYWNEPADFVEAKNGNRRFFTLENQICKALFDLAQDPPKAWLAYKIKVKRRDRDQFAHGAVRSALYAAAFALQSANVRAAVNHEIQSYGAGLTKQLQRLLWDVQPAGVSDFLVVPMNVHDEVLIPVRPAYGPKLREIVDKFLTKNREQVPLLGIEWHDNMKSWAEK
jgi:hypothetical protein